MSNYKHYVPILRWKQAEWQALRDLEPQVKRQVTPLIEFLPTKFNIPDDQALNKHIIKALKTLRDIWSGHGPIFVDYHLCPTRGAQVLNSMYRSSLNMGLELIPVTGLNRAHNYQRELADIVAQHQSKICIRINLENLSSGDFEASLQSLLTLIDISPQSCHLVIDCGLLEDSGGFPFDAILSKIPHIQDWLSCTIVGGNFPKDLTIFTEPGIYRFNRIDWQRWRHEIITNKLPRIPAYGDYTIQHAIYKEPPKNPKGLNVSASIRYASSDYWVIMRGEGLRTKNGPGYDQYPAQAELLKNQPEFCGPDFCAGDKHISLGLQLETKGSPMTWLQVGINHHITFVVDQLANLP